MGKNNGKKNPVWEKKKNAIMRNYQKMLKAKHKNPNFASKHDNNDNLMKQDKKTFFQRAMEEYERKKAEKDRIKAIKDAKRREKDEAIRKYNEKKKENFKKLSKKTKWGQPVMGGRMEILAEKIEKYYT